MDPEQNAIWAAKMERIHAQREMLPAAFDIEVIDRWAPGMLTITKMRAYKRLQDAGKIVIEKVQISRSTAACTVRYRSQMPEEWIRRELQSETEYEETLQRGIVRHEGDYC